MEGTLIRQAGAAVLPGRRQPVPTNTIQGKLHSIPTGFAGTPSFFQLMHLIARQMKAINLICTQMTFLLSKGKRSCEDAHPSPPQRPLGRCVDAAASAPTQWGRGGSRSLHSKMTDPNTCAWILLSAHRTRLKHFPLPFLTSEEARAAKTCTSSRTAEGLLRTHQKARKDHLGKDKKQLSRPSPSSERAWGRGSRVQGFLTSSWELSTSQDLSKMYSRKSAPSPLASAGIAPAGSNSRNTQWAGGLAAQVKSLQGRSALGALPKATGCSQPQCPLPAGAMWRERAPSSLHHPDPQALARA